MTLSKKDYKRVAEILKNAREAYNQKPGNMAINYIEDELMHFFREDNHRFNGSKFLNASNGETE